MIREGGYVLRQAHGFSVLSRYYVNHGTRQRKGSRIDGRVVFLADGSDIRVLRGSLMLSKAEIQYAVAHAERV